MSYKIHIINDPIPGVSFEQTLGISDERLEVLVDVQKVAVAALLEKDELTRQDDLDMLQMAANWANNEQELIYGIHVTTVALNSVEEMMKLKRITNMLGKVAGEIAKSVEEQKKGEENSGNPQHN